MNRHGIFRYIKTPTPLLPEALALDASQETSLRGKLSLLIELIFVKHTRFF